MSVSVFAVCTYISKGFTSYIIEQPLSLAPPYRLGKAPFVPEAMHVAKSLLPGTVTNAMAARMDSYTGSITSKTF